MDGPLGDLFVPGAGVVGPGRGPRIRSSSGGQDEAIGTPYDPVHGRDRQTLLDISHFLIRYPSEIYGKISGERCFHPHPTTRDAVSAEQSD